MGLCKTHTCQNLFFAASIAPDLGIVVQDYTQQGIVDLQVAIVIDEPQFTELVHENVDP
jgi:hypothetical protein